MHRRYEMNGEWNDAPIAYRNAAELFIEEGKSYLYGRKHARATAATSSAGNLWQIGFANEESYYPGC